jgi:translation initiation factor IF-3
VKQFLGEGDKVKLTIMFRGREMVHQEFGRKLLDRMTEELSDLAIIERSPLVEGRNMIMILSPTTKKQARGGDRGHEDRHHGDEQASSANGAAADQPGAVASAPPAGSAPVSAAAPPAQASPDATTADPAAAEGSVTTPQPAAEPRAQPASSAAAAPAARKAAAPRRAAASAATTVKKTATTRRGEKNAEDSHP